MWSPVIAIQLRIQKHRDRKLQKKIDAYHAGSRILAQRLDQQRERQLYLIEGRDADDRIFDTVEEARRDFE